MAVFIVTQEMKKQMMIVVLATDKHFGSGQVNIKSKKWLCEDFYKTAGGHE